MWSGEVNNSYCELTNEKRRVKSKEILRKRDPGKNKKIDWGENNRNKGKKIEENPTMYKTKSPWVIRRSIF
jgi:hypothetical protein